MLGDHLSEKSDVGWIDTSAPHKRNRRLKDHKVLQEVAKHDPDTMDIFEGNLIDTYYPNPPRDLDDLRLYDFVANYDWYGKNDRGDCKYKKLAKPRLPNHKIFDPDKESQREDYFYSLLLLFIPFRDESTLLQENETAEEAFNRLLPSNSTCSAYHAKLQKVLEAQSHIKNINDARQAEGEEEKINKEEDKPQLMGEAKTAMEDMFDMNANVQNDLTLAERVDMLNADQKHIFDKVKSHLLHQKMHENKTCHCNFKPLHMFGGVGGTGKSFLIEAIKLLVAGIWPSDDVTCAISALTGLAAFNVGGITIHEHEGKTATYWSLPKAAQKVMKTTR